MNETNLAESGRSPGTGANIDAEVPVGGVAAVRHLLRELCINQNMNMMARNAKHTPCKTRTCRLLLLLVERRPFEATEAVSRMASD